MIGEIALALAGACTLGGTYFAGRQASDFRLAGRRKLTVPLNADTGEEATLLLPWELAEREWGQFLDVVMAMGAGLVVGPVPEAPERLPLRTEPRVRRSSEQGRNSEQFASSGDPLDDIREHEREVEEAARDEEPFHGAHPFRGRR